MLDNDAFFATVIMILIPFLVAIVLKVADSIGFIWAKVNQPTISAILGAVIGAIYHLESVYLTLNGVSPNGTLATFIVAGTTAGLGGAGLRSLVKDVTSGALGVNSVEDVQAMRKTTRAQQDGEVGP